MNHTISAAYRDTVTSGATTPVTLSINCVYFRIMEEGGGGSIRWGTTQAQAESADEYHAVAANGDSGVIVANPATLYIHAEGGNVNYYVFEVRVGD